MSGRKQFDVDTALDQAMRVFWAHSYADATLDRLSAATGLGRGSLYGAFGTKDVLFQRSLERYASVYGTQYDDALTAYSGDPVHAVEAFLNTVIARVSDPSVPPGCLIAQSAMEAPELGDASRGLLRMLLDSQQQRIGRALATSGAPASTIDDLALFVVAVNQSLAVLSRSGSSIEDLRSVAAVAVRAVADALRTAAPLADASPTARAPDVPHG